MSVQAAPSNPQGLTDQQDRRLRGYRLTLSRAMWLALAAVSLAHIVTSLPREYARRGTICSAAPCEPVTLTPGHVDQLTALGLPLQFFATYVVAVELLFAIVALVVGGIIFWRRSNDPMALFAALMLVSFASLA